MKRYGKPLQQLNQINSYSCSGVQFQYPFTYTSPYIAKARLELSNNILHSKNRRIRRNPLSERNSVVSLSRYNIRSNSATPFLYSEWRSLLLKSKFSENSFGTNFTINFQNPSLKIETVTEKPQMSMIKPQRTSLLQFKRDTKSRISFTSSYMVQKVKEEFSQGQLVDFKLKGGNYEEIVELICLSYTFRMIERSACLDDRDWSGSFLPHVENNSPLLYAGGYGLLDGVTECKFINLAASRYQNIDLVNNEELDALSHMYSMQHLIEGVAQVRRESNKFSFNSQFSVPISDGSQSSKIS